MALSVLKTGPGFNNFGLYDSTSERFMLAGTQDEMFEWKDRIESREQQQANLEYFVRLRQEWTDLLVKAGNTELEAKQFLQSSMPFLYEDKTA